MGTLADKLTYLGNTKQAIKQAIIDKGVEVSNADTFRSYATKIADISGGGGGTPAEWEWPADWPDITSIVENDTDNTNPYKCIWLLDGTNPYFDYTFGTNVEKVLLSDGATYTASFADHEWGTNTDTSITDYRYVILYMSYNSSFQTNNRPISITYNSAFLSGKTNFSSMFYRCYSLQTIPLLDTSSVTNFSSMFRECYSLQTIPPLDTSSGTNFSYMFRECYSLQTIPPLDTSSGTNFSYMFRECYSLQTIPLLDTSSVTNFSSMFRECYSLQTIPPLDTSSVTNFSSMLSYCYSLQTIPPLDTSSGTNFSYMLSYCYSLQTIPPLDTSSGTNFSYMLSYCYSLQYLDTSNVSSWVFNYSIDFSVCSYLAYNTALAIINKLPTTTGQTIKFHTTTLDKLTEEEKAIATNKGWIVST